MDIADRSAVKEVYMETKSRITVEVDHIGEGWWGDYNPNDPADKPLLRFYVLRNGEYLDDASYCTQTVDCEENADLLAAFVLDAVIDFAQNRESIKKLCERLSWVDIESVVT